MVLQVWGYRKHRKPKGDIFDTVELDLPPVEMDTRGVWIDLPPSLAAHVEATGGDFLGGIHGAAHAIINVIPLFVLCERTDLGTECPSVYQERARPLRLVIYDDAEGGSGVCREVFPLMERVLAAARDLVAQCQGCGPQGHGCPRCVQDPHCSEYNEVLDKAAALRILDVALGRGSLPPSPFKRWRQ